MEATRGFTPTRISEWESDYPDRETNAQSVTPISLKVENLSMQLSQLADLMAITCGDAFHSFSDMEEDTRHWYLTLCAQLVDECRNAARDIAQQSVEIARETATA